MTDIITPPAIAPLPTPPDPNDRATFNTRAYPWSVAQGVLATEIGAVAANVHNNAIAAKERAEAAELEAVAAENHKQGALIAAADASESAVAASESAITALSAPGTSATSDTTLTVSAGVKLLTIQEGKSFVPGMTVVIAEQSTPTTRMVGVVIEYAGTALTVDVRSTEGSGDYSAWIVSITAADTPHTHDYLTDAPIDGKPYARQSGAWEEVDPKGESNLIRQLVKTSNYTLTLADAGRHILHPGTDTTARTFTIPANASVPYEIGTAITFVNQNGTSGVVTIAITSDTMRLAERGTTGSRTLARNGVATALKIDATEWIISGVGLT